MRVYARARRADLVGPVGACPAPAGLLPAQPRRDLVAGACSARLASEGYWQRASYQPASRFWALRAAETGIYLALAAALAGICAWRVRRVA